MTIGRLSFNSAYDVNGKWVWAGDGMMRPMCGCIIVELGFMVVTWHGRECKCSACGGYTCRCPKEKD